MAINVSDLPPKYQAQAMKKYMEQQQRRGPAPPAAPPQDPAKGTKYHNTPTERVTASGAVLHFDSQKISIHAPREGRDSKSEQISLHIFAKKAWISDIFAQNAAFQSVLPLADRQKLLYLRCEPLRKFLRAFASHYKIIGSSGR